MIFEQIRTGGDRTFSYLIGDEESSEAAVADPGYDPEMLLERVAERGLKLKYVINTHDHFDHTGGNRTMLEATGARLASYNSRDVPLKDGAVMTLGSLELHVLHTPGHTRDGICIIVDDVVLTGDTLFVGKVGGTDFGEGARTEYESLHNKLLTLPDHLRVFPGHDYGVRPSSTIGDEKRENPFLLRKDFKDFLHLKKNWEAYKRKHGIQ
jgi:glyoxylase-like metal-dependent hydrolase (beta-lactamase superfamily II)